MSTVDYIIKTPSSSGALAAPFDWANEPFYTTAVVLGIDIGIEGMGVWLRKGRKQVYARTFLFNTPEAAPLKARRLLRGGRRCRQSERHREVLLKQFCAEFDLPWTEIKDEKNEDGPFKLRLRAVRSKLASKEALVVCLRHIVKHRGYDYHEADGGLFPWGDELKAEVAMAWAKAAYCSQNDAEGILHDVSDCGWNDKQLATFRNTLNFAVERYKLGITAALEKHFAQRKNNLRVPARKHNFPRSLVWKHMEEICRNHSDFFRGEAQLSAALIKLKKILNYHRKPPGALAERKVNRCPIATHLFGGTAPKCDLNSNPHIRRLKLLEFISTRSFVSKNGTRLLANSVLIKWLLDDILAEDIRTVEANKVKGGQKQDRRKFGGFREEFIKKFDPEGEIQLASDRVSHNKDFFEQLTDLLRPKLSVLKARASLCGKSAECIFKRAINDGFQADIIGRNLKEKQFEGQSFYTLRQAAAAGFGIYPQVEFLLGRRSKKGRQAVPGVLRRIFERPEITAALGHQKTPDYVVIETVRDMPRNTDQAKEIHEEQKRRREFKDRLFEKFGVQDQQQDSESRKRVLLYDQQGGSRGEAVCPYTGDSLGNDPLSPTLQIDHVFPESRGGISEMVNLVLTHEKTNNKCKGNQTPYEAFGGKQDTAEWRALVGRVQKMGWNAKKRELVLRAESSCPEWDNMTRMAQLARQLREEAARWLGVFGDDAKVRQKIGTPTGYQTSVCRESWNENLPVDFYPKKNRNNLRHHLWDAAILSHIPPGKGLNDVHCHGIFWSESKPGNIKMLALPGLGPDLKQFEKETAEQCLVEKVQPAHTKQSRYQQTIYSPPDKTGVMWARDPITKLADKTNLLNLLRDAGIDERQLPTKRFDEWQEKRQAQFFTREEALLAVESLALPPEHQIPSPVFEEWWTDRLKGDKKRVTDKSLRALLAKARVPKVIVSDVKVSGALLNRGDPGPLTRKDGTEIRGVSGGASTMTPMAVIPHRNHQGETIGYKLATESFGRAEIWTTEKRDKNDNAIKGKNGKPVLEYHRRLIPHPRGLKNLSLRILKCTGKRLTWERRLAENEIIELGLKDNAAVNRLRKNYEKALKQHEKRVTESKLTGSELALTKAGAIAKPTRPVISLRKIYTGLPPHAKRLKNANGADISRIFKGDLLRVALRRVPGAEKGHGKFCKRGEAASVDLYWFRVSAIKASGEIELHLAEFKLPKIEDNNRTTEEQKWLIDIWEQRPSNEDDVGWLLEQSRAHDQPPHPAK